MVAGVRIRPEDGSLIQIDPTWECLAMKTLGSVVCPVNGSTGRGTITVGGCNEPILAVRSNGSFVGILSKTQSGATFTWTLVTSVPGATVDYWIFDTTDVAQMAFNTTKGMRFRNSSNGRVLFDSRYKYMRILQMINMDAGTGSVDVAIPLTSGYAVAISNSGFYTTVVGGSTTPGFWFIQRAGYVAGIRTNTDGTVSVGLIQLAASTQEGQGTPPPTGLMGNRNLLAQVLDMRNY